MAMGVPACVERGPAAASNGVPSVKRRARPQLARPLRAMRAMALTKFAAAVTEVMLPRPLQRVRNGAFLHRATGVRGPQLTDRHRICGVCASRRCTPWHVGCDWARP
jgi:hypothetical protein